MLEHADLIVTKGASGARRMLERPWRGSVHAPTYGGPWVTLELDVVAVAGEMLCVEQPRPQGDVWRAWVPRAAVTRLGAGGHPEGRPPAPVTPAG